MKNALRCFATATALAGASLALAQHRTAVQPTYGDPVVVPDTKPIDATPFIKKITNLKTGAVKYYDGNAGAARGIGNVVYDSLTAPQPELTFNGSFSDAAGAMLCKYPLDPNEVMFYSFAGAGSEGCGSGLPGLEAADPDDDGVNDGPRSATTILWDSMQLDGNGPNQLHNVTQVDGTLYFGNTDFGADITIVFGGAENADYDGDGIFELVGGVGITFGFDPNSPAGRYVFDNFALDPNFQFEIYGDGFFLVDAVDLNEFGNPTCGVGVPMTGGNPRDVIIGGVNYSDPNCTHPDELLTVGDTFVLGLDPNSTRDIWIWQNADPNSILDPGADGDPNTISYTDIWNSPSGIWWAFIDGETQLSTAFSAPLRIWSDSAGGGTCAGDCDGNNVVDITDLGQLLSGFNQSPGTCDTDGSGTTDVSDLGALLANFNQPCP